MSWRIPKNRLLPVHEHLADAILRSKTPELVRQEFWGLLLAHHVVRKLMVEAALIQELPPIFAILGDHRSCSR